MPDTETCRELGFGSKEALYRRLANDGFPVCVSCGATPEKPNHCEARKQRKDQKQRKARSSGDPVELPPADRAKDLFRKDVEELVENIDELHNLRETLQAERFVSSVRIDDDWEWFYRKDFSEEEWRKLCETGGADPDLEEVFLRLDTSFHPSGVRKQPYRVLTYLIALHVLMGGSVNPLLEALHPATEELDWEEMRKELYGERGVVTTLKNSANQLATVVRGGKVRRGPPPGEVSRKEQWIAWYLIRPLADREYTNEQILTELVDEGYLEEGEDTEEEIARLRHLNLPFPE